MNIRPHHLLCIQKFTGHGYSADFTAHMQSVVSALKEHPGTRITVVPGCDALCARCPNRAGGVCASAEKVAFMDRAVLGACSLAWGEAVLWAEASGRARERVFETGEFHHICACCQWYALCRHTEVLQ